MFEVKEIQKSYPNKEVLKGVSFSIEKGDRIAFLGNNGAGKSTLLKIIAGQIPANAGHIQTSLDYRTEIGMMPQGDILKGCMNHLPKIDLEAALKKVSLQEFRNQYVGGLSGGQKRRLSLLLTILNSPKLIFLDEPTTGMDLESVDDFWALLKKENFTSLIVTHDFNQIDHFFTKVLILKNGRIAAADTVTDIHHDGKTIEQYYREKVEQED